MSKNTLYNFIQQYVPSITHVKYLELAKDKQQHHYYRLELNQKTPIVLNNYTLLNHHISIYETEVRSNPQLSQYHYTAYFDDGKGSTYRLHVYFNAFDELTRNAAFAIQTENSFEVIESKELEESFIGLALQNTEPVINELRKKQATIVNDLETRYAQLEQELAELFETSKENYFLYLQKLEETCSVLQTLIPLVRHSTYNKIHHFLSRSQKTLIANLAQEESIEDAIAIKPDFGKKELEEATTTPAPSVKKTQSNQSNADSTAVSEFDKKFKQLVARFDAIKSADAEIQAKDLEDLLARTYEFSLLLSEKDATVTNLQNLENLRLNIYRLGEKLLPTLLVKKEFALASQLTSFHYLLKEKHLNWALQTRNPELLDFVLTHGDFNINSQEVHVKEKAYSSAVHACMSCHSDSSPMTDCLSILIKHGASLFVDSSNGLPLAYEIMTNDNHPFRGALLANREKTIDSVIFYKQLRAFVTDYLKREKVSQAAQKGFQEALDYYNTQIEILLAPEMQSASAKILQRKFTFFEEKHLGKLADKLRKDLELRAASKLLQEASRELLKLVNKGHIKRNSTNITDSLDNLDKLLVKWNIKLDDEYDFVKACTLKHLEGSLLLVNKKIQLLTIQKQMVPVHLNGKVSRRQKKLHREEAALLVEINELEKRFGFTQDFKQLDEGIDAIDKMDDAINELNQVVKGLEQMSRALESLNIKDMLHQFSALFSELPPELSKPIVTQIDKKVAELKEEQEEEQEKEVTLGRSI
ncbi:coiled-coil-containing protein [Legionella lansingensis]|uniref:Coiled-coil-containing protein n=1 Tax=Legionella lansingensis TaxID=45067 RepID=A0A0W0VGS2_9GAMM|nr:hypothetical protein [Legionella lansingensis]KTD19320.1 coiled-coil-containing protein [Legionella lansingensis]SNV50409.1 coiled-coil-containing protein [Legionella lansingensis]